MQKISTGTNMTIFLIFFGMSLFEALGSRTWSWAAFWLAIGLVFLGANRLSR